MTVIISGGLALEAKLSVKAHLQLLNALPTVDIFCRERIYAFHGVDKSTPYELVPARDFSSDEDQKTFIILCVYESFQNARLAEKTRQFRPTRDFASGEG